MRYLNRSSRRRWSETMELRTRKNENKKCRNWTWGPYISETLWPKASLFNLCLVPGPSYSIPNISFHCILWIVVKLITCKVICFWFNSNKAHLSVFVSHIYPKKWEYIWYKQKHPLNQEKLTKHIHGIFPELPKQCKYVNRVSKNFVGQITNWTNYLIN